MLQKRCFLMLLILVVSVPFASASACLFVHETGRRELNRFELCVLKRIFFQGQIQPLTNGDYEPRIPFGPFDIEGTLQDDYVAFRLQGKNWTSEPIVMKWSATEINEIPILHILTNEEAARIFRPNPPYSTEYKDVRLTLEDTKVSRTIIWKNPILIFYGRGNACFGAEEFTDWSFSVTAQKADTEQLLGGTGKVRITPEPHSDCDP